MANKKAADDISAASRKRMASVNSKFHRYFSDVASNTIGNDQANANELDNLRKQMDDAINTEYNDMTIYSGGDMTRFINDALKDPNGNGTTMDKVINDDANSFSTFFYERYKNINNKYEDLRMIVENLCELSTAVTTLRDNVVASDGIMSNLGKTIVIEGLSEDKEKKLREMIDDIEEKYDLATKLHDTIILNTLTYGDFFVFHQPYARIFSKFATQRKDRPYYMMEGTSIVPVKETYVPSKGKKVLALAEDISNDINMVFESYRGAISTDFSGKEKPKLTKEMVRDYLTEIYSKTEVINDGHCPLFEDANIASLSDPKLLKMIANKKREKGPKAFSDIRDVTPPDSVVNTDDITQDARILPEYKDISGVYMKLMSPLRTVPVYVLDECIGYYILYETFGEIRNNMLQNNQLNRTNLVFQQVRNKDAATSIVDVIASRIIRKIDNKFIKNNIQFRDLMVNALMYDDLYRKDFKVQFVSAEYMTHFRVNEDIDTHLGTSMLKRSLFYGKLYMTMLMFKVVSTVTRSNDTRVFYIKNSGIEKNIQNQVQRAAREYKDNQISYNDVASVNTLVSKAGKAKDLFVGTGRSGERPVEFDILAGQDIQMNTDFIEFLRKNMINGTDVPAVILEYNDAADFAKSIEMGNIKYATKICGTQKELNHPATKMYRSILRFEHPELDETEIQSVSFKFNRPKALSVQNDADTYNNSEQAATFLVKSICGDNTEKYSDQVKDMLFNYIIKNVLLPGMYDWETLEAKADEFTRLIKQSKKEAELAGTGTPAE